MWVQETELFNLLQEQLLFTVTFPAQVLTYKKEAFWGWRDGLVVKSTGCYSRGPEFSSQQPHGGPQPSVIGSDALF